MEWKLKDLTVDGKGSYGIGAPAVPYQEDKLTYLRITDINDDGSLNFSDLKSVDAEDAEKYILKENDIVFARTGNSTGRSYFYEKQHGTFVYAGFLIKFSLDPHKVNPRILKYYTHSKPYFDWVNSFDTGGTRGNINAKTYGDMEIELPSRKVQDNIVSILSSLDRKIELNNKINADLEEMAQAIFKNWLSECSDDVTIGELSLNITNYEKVDAEEVVLINSSDVTEGYFDHHNYSPNKNLKGHFKKRFQKGDILYSQVRPRNRHWAYCNFDANDYLASTQLMVIRNNPSLITSILLYQYIISDNVWKEFTLKTETRSGTFPQGNYEDLSQILVPYDSDVEGISNQLETLYAKMFMLKKENLRLSHLRDTLLPKLMSGELEVSE